jgi:hypothetical protein
MNKSGMWRRKAEFLPDATYEQAQHPIAVMVWGAVGPGFRIHLLRCPGHVNAERYVEMLADARIFGRLIAQYGSRGFWRQQDNAPANAACADVIRANFNILNLPPPRADLSPIEMVWALIKHKLKGLRFANANALFAAIFQAWQEIPQDVIDNLCGNFPARCQVRVELSGISLNGHWREVHRVHHELGRENVPPKPTIADE